MKSAAMTVNSCLSSDTCTQLLMPVLASLRRCVFPGVKFVTAYFPPYVEVMEPLTSRLSAIGGPVAWSATAFSVNLPKH